MWRLVPTSAHRQRGCRTGSKCSGMQAKAENSSRERHTVYHASEDFIRQDGTAVDKFLRGHFVRLCSLDKQRQNNYFGYLKLHRFTGR